MIREKLESPLNRRATLHRRPSSMTPAELLEAEEFNVPVAAPLQSIFESENNAAAPTTANDWPAYLIHPHRAPRNSWDVLTVILILYSVVAIPFILAFDPPSARAESGAMFLINRGIDCTFMVDVIINFFTAVDDGDKGMITDLAEIRRRYTKGWFSVDVLSAFPMDMVMNDAESSRVKAIQLAKSLKVFRLLRVFRIFRVLRIQRILARLEHAFVIRHHVRHLVADMAIVLLLAHWCSCCFYGAGAANCSGDVEGDDEDCYGSWIRDAGLEGSPISRKYVSALYWTTTTITTVGFGDIAPVNGFEQFVAIVVMILGALMTAFGVSHVGKRTIQIAHSSSDRVKSLFAHARPSTQCK
jgi:hypothetical protein